MAEWRWYQTEETLPEIATADGMSHHVLAFPGNGCLPQVVKYSDGTYAKRGWWTTDNRYLSEYVHAYSGSKKQRFPFWSPIEQPTFLIY